MSLDIYLKEDPKEHKCICAGCGNEHDTYDEETVYTANITHNLGAMASRAGIYQHLWRPEELDITRADQLITPLTKGLQKLKDKPEYYKEFNSENLWGVYEDFIKFVEDYLNACIQYPNSNIEVYR